MIKYNTDGFLATVLGEAETDGLWRVDPLRIQIEGSDHPEIEVLTRDGIRPQGDDIVLILTMRNDLDLEPINDYFVASDTNGVIVGIVKTSSAQLYIMKGNYKFDGNLEITKDLEVKGNVVITGTLKVGGVNYSAHTHLPGTYSNSGGPVTGVSGGLAP